MGPLTNIIVGGLFVTMLVSGDDKVPVPKSEWRDGVGQSIQSAVESDISGFNNALNNCKDTLTSVKYKTESNALAVNFQSRRQELDWQRQQIESVNVNYIVERYEQILKG